MCLLDEMKVSFLRNCGATRRWGGDALKFVVKFPPDEITKLHYLFFMVEICPLSNLFDTKF